jgi:hypothetical protein
MSTGQHVSDWDLTDAEVMVLSRKVLGWADRVFVAYRRSARARFSIGARS